MCAILVDDLCHFLVTSLVIPIEQNLRNPWEKIAANNSCPTEVKITLLSELCGYRKHDSFIIQNPGYTLQIILVCNPLFIIHDQPL